MTAAGPGWLPAATPARRAAALGMRNGFTFSGGFTDWALNFLNGNHERPILLLAVGIVYGVIYFAVFYFLIKFLNLKTPGREDEGEDGVIPADPAEATGSTDPAATAGSADARSGADQPERPAPA